MKIKRRADEIIPVSRGGVNVPDRFISRGLCSADELPDLVKAGWRVDTGKFALNPNDFEIGPRTVDLSEFES